MWINSYFSFSVYDPTHQSAFTADYPLMGYRYCPPGYRTLNEPDASGDVNGGHCYLYDPTLIQDCPRDQDKLADKNIGSPKSCQDNVSQAGNPIHIGIGNKYQVEKDYASNRLTFSRNYNSMVTGATNVLGNGWNHTFHRILHYRSGPKAATGPDIITAIRDDGKYYKFSLSGNSWISDADITDKLVRLSDASGALIGWQYTTPDDSVEHYDASGILQSITDVRGNTQTLAYDTIGRLSNVTTSTGESLIFNYDAGSHINTMTDQAGRVWRYGYDANNNLTSATYPDATPSDATDNPQRVYLYENTSFPHALTSITDCAHAATCSTAAVNHYANFEYDTQGRATASYHGPQTSVLTNRIEGVSVIYNGDGTSTVTNSLGKVSTYATAVQLGKVLITGISGPGCSSCGISNTTATSRVTAITTPTATPVVSSKA